LNPSTAIEELIPHRPPMRWIDALTECTETTATATTRFSAGHFAVAGGEIAETALVECVAQTVAAALGQRMRTSGKPAGTNHGMLAAVSNFKILTRPQLDQTLTIQVRELKRLGPMLMVAGTISCAGQPIATGELSLYA
jgi:predicted hotdog family 3-hydroxylacyl-ACP dehydratase